MRLIAVLLGALVLAVSCTSGAQVATRSTTDWPMFRGDLWRDGHPQGATLTRDQLKHYRLKWSHTLNGAVDGTPVVVNGLVYAASFGGRLDAYHLADGARVWSVDGLGAISGTPAISGHTLVVGTLAGHVLALDATNGKKLWDWPAPGSRPAIWSSPRSLVPIVLEAPTVRTHGALPGAAMPPHCRLPSAFFPALPAAATTTMPLSVSALHARVNGSVQYDS